MSTCVLGSPFGLTLAVCEDSRVPGVLADACCSHPWLWALILSPPCVCFRCEAEHVRSPEFLLSLGTPSFLPGPMATLWRDVSVMLGTDRPVLPTKPLSCARPWRLP